MNVVVQFLTKLRPFKVFLCGGVVWKIFPNIVNKENVLCVYTLSKMLILVQETLLNNELIDGFHCFDILPIQGSKNKSTLLSCLLCKQTLHNNLHTASCTKIYLQNGV